MVLLEIFEVGFEMQLSHGWPSMTTTSPGSVGDAATMGETA
jgi:hypothetical protein